ncbi:hypothetical protein [Streptomyces sp. NPDC056244]|uniref:hypothetical protein n=1 Tax=Streptomyces sp. NPDC056244 TaxID=3345762 RepID=UPI0035D90CD3
MLLCVVAGRMQRVTALEKFRVRETKWSGWWWGGEQSAVRLEAVLGEAVRGAGGDGRAGPRIVQHLEALLKVSFFSGP